MERHFTLRVVEKHIEGRFFKKYMVTLRSSENAAFILNQGLPFPTRVNEHDYYAFVPGEDVSLLFESDDGGHNWHVARTD